MIHDVGGKETGCEVVVVLTTSSQRVYDVHNVLKLICSDVLVCLIELQDFYRCSTVTRPIYTPTYALRGPSHPTRRSRMPIK